MKIPELLAPVGNMNHLKLAIYNGASSIYLSGKDFGARKYAENFTIDEIKEAVKFAHLYNVKVYVTVNILIKEGELESVIDYVMDLYKIGVDAILVQDIGLIKIIKEIIPNLKIHASTQLNIHNKEGIDWAKSQGIKRVVLSRELSLSEVKEITKYAHKNNIECEIFAHGALCYSYSGHCLLSSYIGGRSGNRGRCAQPCRQKYSLVFENGSYLDENFLKESEEKYLLSPKDLSLYDDLEKILLCDSLKIEGRMRSEEYVAIVVSKYRQALNKLRHNKNIPKGEELSLVFNRKFTRGHLLDRPNKIMNYNKPSNNGLFIGKVVDFNGKNQIKIKTETTTIPEKGDGILIEGKSMYENATASYGFELSLDAQFDNDLLVLKTIRENKNIDIKIDKDSKVYISKRNEIVNRTKQDLKCEHHSYKKSILNLNFKIDKNNYPIIKGRLKIGNGNIIQLKYKGEEQWQTARNRPVDSDKIKTNLQKVDNLPFYIEHININYKEDLFTPNSSLNQLRREFYKKLTVKIEESYIPQDLDKVKVNYKKYKDNFYREKYRVQNKNIESEKSISLYINSLETLERIDNKLNINRIYLEIPDYDKNILFKDYKSPFNINYCVNFLKEAYNISMDKNYELVWKWPDITNKETLNGIFKVLGILSKFSININIMCSALGLIEVLKTEDRKIYGSSYLNVYNHETIKNLNKFDVLTLSPELSKEDISELVKNTDLEKIEMIVGGVVEAMISKKPILPKNNIKNLKKDLNIKITKDTDINLSIKDMNNNYYPVKGSITNDIILLYNKNLSLIKEINYLKSIGILNFAVDLRWEDNENINKIINIFNESIFNDLDNNALNKLNNKLNEYYFETTDLNFNKTLK
ncbi:peptidase U32 family protein [Methanobrevibacter sp.]